MKVTIIPKTPYKAEGDVEIEFSKVCDRSNLIRETPLREQGLKPLMWDRIDMFTAKVYITKDGKKLYFGTFFISPKLDGSSNLTFDWNTGWEWECKLTNKEFDQLEKMVRNAFAATPHSANMRVWTKALIDAGYPKVRYGRGPCLCCPVCGSQFLILGKHWHREYEGKKYPYHSPTDCIVGEQPTWEPGVLEAQLVELGKSRR